MNDSYMEWLVEVFEKLHGCKATHLETVPVIEKHEGKIIWEGDVEVFRLTGHPQADRGYAWAYDKKKGNKTTAVLELPPVTSAKMAVRASIMAQIKAETDGLRSTTPFD